MRDKTRTYKNWKKLILKQRLNSALYYGKKYLTTYGSKLFNKRDYKKTLKKIIYYNYQTIVMKLSLNSILYLQQQLNNMFCFNELVLINEIKKQINIYLLAKQNKINFNNKNLKKIFK